MKTFGREIVSNFPEESTELFKRVCQDSGKDLTTLVESLSILYFNQPEWHVKFIEDLISRNIQLSSKIYNILLDLYLKLDSGQDIKNYEAKALEMLKNERIEYDPVYAMMICKKYNCQIGTLILFKKQGMYKEMLEYYIQTNEYVSIISTCKKYGEIDSSLWMKALVYFSTRHEECKDYLQEALENSQKFLNPLEIIQILSKNPEIPFSIIKDHLQAHLREQMGVISQNERDIINLKEEIKKYDTEINELKTKYSFELT